MDPDFTRQYYDVAASNHWWFHGRRFLVHGLLETRGTDSGTFIDLGAGSKSPLPDRINVVKVDIVKPPTAGGMFVQATAERLPFRSSRFDGAGLFDVIEHLDRPDTCLAETRRVVRRGGVLMVTVPSHEWLRSIHDETAQHRRRYTRTSLRHLLSTAGFAVDWISAFYGFLVPPAFVRSVLSCNSSMELPGERINRLLTEVAEWSVRGALRSPRRIGLSLAAVCTAL